MDKGLYSDELMKLIGRDNNGWIPYDEIVKRAANGESILDMMNGYDSLVVLYYTISPQYGHWTCIIRHSNPTRLEFFDPYGFTIDGVVRDIKPSLKKKMLQQFPTLSYLFYLTGLPIEYNEHQLQGKGDHISTCGYWTGCRIQWKDIPLERFQEIFATLRKHGYDCDKIVYNLNAPKLGYDPIK